VGTLEGDLLELRNDPRIVCRPGTLRYTSAAGMNLFAYD
jgi:hypothetical protein